MRYVEIPIEEAMKRCKKNAKVLVAEQDLENDDCEITFVLRGRSEYDSIFSNIKTASELTDDFIKQLRLYTEKQDITNIQPHGIQKIVLIKEWRQFIGQQNFLYWQTRTNVLKLFLSVRQKEKPSALMRTVGAVSRTRLSKTNINTRFRRTNLLELVNTAEALLMIIITYIYYYSQANSSNSANYFHYL